MTCLAQRIIRCSLHACGPAPVPVYVRAWRPGGRRGRQECAKDVAAPGAFACSTGLHGLASTNATRSQRDHRGAVPDKSRPPETTRADAEMAVMLCPQRRMPVCATHTAAGNTTRATQQQGTPRVKGQPTWRSPPKETRPPWFRGQALLARGGRMLAEVLKDGVEVTCSMQTRERESRWAARVMISSDTSSPSAPAIRPPNTTMCSPGAKAKTDAARRQELRTCSKQARACRLILATSSRAAPTSCLPTPPPNAQLALVY